MTKPDGFDYEMMPFLSRFSLEGSVILKATINTINRIERTANVTLASTCEGVEIDTDAVEFFYHCEFSDGSEKDLLEGHWAFRKNEEVYLINIPPVDDQPEQTYIIGHVEIPFQNRCIREVVYVYKYDFEDPQPRYISLFDYATKTTLDPTTLELPNDPDPPTLTPIGEGVYFPRLYDEELETWLGHYFEGMTFGDDNPVDITVTSPNAYHIDIDGQEGDQSRNYDLYEYGASAVEPTYTGYIPRQPIPSTQINNTINSNFCDVYPRHVSWTRYSLKGHNNVGGGIVFESEGEFFEFSDYEDGMNLEIDRFYYDDENYDCFYYNKHEEYNANIKVYDIWTNDLVYEWNEPLSSVLDGIVEDIFGLEGYVHGRLFYGFDRPAFGFGYNVQEVTGLYAHYMRMGFNVLHRNYDNLSGDGIEFDPVALFSDVNMPIVTPIHKLSQYDPDGFTTTWKELRDNIDLEATRGLRQVMDDVSAAVCAELPDDDLHWDNLGSVAHLIPVNLSVLKKRDVAPAG